MVHELRLSRQGKSQLRLMARTDTPGGSAVKRRAARRTVRDALARHRAGSR